MFDHKFEYIRDQLDVDVSFFNWKVLFLFKYINRVSCKTQKCFKAATLVRKLLRVDVNKRIRTMHLIIDVIAAIITVLLNVIAISCIVLRRRPLKSLDLFLLSIFVNVIVYAIFVTVKDVMIEHIHKEDHVNQLGHPVYSNKMLTVISWLTLVLTQIHCTVIFLISIQRFILVNSPMKGKAYTSIKATRIQIICSFILYLFIFVLCVSFESAYKFPIILAMVFNWTLLIEGVVMMLMYIEIIICIRKQLCGNSRKKHLKPVYLSAAITVSFIISYFPITVVRIKQSPIVESYIQHMIWIDCITNTIFYFITFSNNQVGVILQQLRVFDLVRTPTEPVAENRMHQSLPTKSAMQQQDFSVYTIRQHALHTNTMQRLSTIEECHPQNEP